MRSADLAICVSMPWWLSMLVAISGSTQTYNCFPLCRVFKTSQAPLLLCSPSTNFSLQIRLFEVSVFWADVVRSEVRYWDKNNYCRFSMFFFSEQRSFKLFYNIIATSVSGLTFLFFSLKPPSLQFTAVVFFSRIRNNFPFAVWEHSERSLLCPRPARSWSSWLEFPNHLLLLPVSVGVRARV